MVGQGGRGPLGDVVVAMFVLVVQGGDVETVVVSDVPAVVVMGVDSGSLVGLDEKPGRQRGRETRQCAVQANIA